MKIRYSVYILLISVAFAACKKSNEVSKIPQISFIYFGTQTSTDSFIYSVDTPYIVFKFTDGDGDIGNGPNGAQKDIYIRDIRPGGYDSTTGYFFPDNIDTTIEDPQKGVYGTCYFLLTEDIFTPRSDTDHIKHGDTAQFEVYIVDRKGNKSNSFTTPKIIMRP